MWPDFIRCSERVRKEIESFRFTFFFSLLNSLLIIRIGKLCLFLFRFECVVSANRNGWQRCVFLCFIRYIFFLLCTFQVFLFVYILITLKLHACDLIMHSVLSCQVLRWKKNELQLVNLAWLFFIVFVSFADFDSKEKFMFNVGNTVYKERYTKKKKTKP